MAEITQAPADLPPAQRPLIDEHRMGKVKIVGGMSEHALEDPPEVGDERTYIVKARCKEHHIKEIDGELRLVCDMEQFSIYERGKVPIVDERQPGLFDADDEAKDDTDDAADDPEQSDDEEPTTEQQGKVTSLFSDGGDES